MRDLRLCFENSTRAIDSSKISRIDFDLAEIERFEVLLDASIPLVDFHTGANRNVASLSSPKRKNGAPPLDAPDALYAPAPPVVSATQPKRSLRELAARAGAEGPRRGAPRRFPDPVLEARICRGSPPLASARQLVPGDPGSLTLSPSAAGSLNLSPSPPNSPRKRAPNRAVRVVEVGADPRGAASRHY